jgi:hypothetical protein
MFRRWRARAKIQKGSDPYGKWDQQPYPIQSRERSDVYNQWDQQPYPMQSQERSDVYSIWDQTPYPIQSQERSDVYSKWDQKPYPMQSQEPFDLYSGRKSLDMELERAPRSGIPMAINYLHSFDNESPTKMAPCSICLKILRYAIGKPSSAGFNSRGEAANYPLYKYAEFANSGRTCPLCALFVKYSLLACADGQELPESAPEARVLRHNDKPTDLIVLLLDLRFKVYTKQGL